MSFVLFFHRVATKDVSLSLPTVALTDREPISRPLVDNSQIKSATLHTPLPLFVHAYIWPFAIIWPIFFAFYLSEERYNTYLGAPEWTFLWSGSIVTLQALTWLVTKWSVDFDVLFTATQAGSVGEAQLIKVHPVENAGSAQICKLERETVRVMQRWRRATNLALERRREDNIISFPEKAILLRCEEKHVCATILCN